MATQLQLIRRILDQPADLEYAMTLWDTRDIELMEDDNGVPIAARLTQNERDRVIRRMDDEHDCNDGLTWNTLQSWCNLIRDTR